MNSVARGGIVPVPGRSQCTVGGWEEPVLYLGLWRRCPGPRLCHGIRRRRGGRRGQRFKEQDEEIKKEEEEEEESSQKVYVLVVKERGRGGGGGGWGRRRGMGRGGGGWGRGEIRRMYNNDNNKAIIFLYTLTSILTFQFHITIAQKRVRMSYSFFTILYIFLPKSHTSRVI